MSSMSDMANSSSEWVLSSIARSSSVSSMSDMAYSSSDWVLSRAGFWVLSRAAISSSVSSMSENTSYSSSDFAMAEVGSVMTEVVGLLT